MGRGQGVRGRLWIGAGVRGEREPVRDRDADQRCAADREAPYRRRDVAIVPGLDVSELAGQQRLVNEAQRAIAPLDGR